MGMVLADPVMLEKLAASMDRTAKEIPALRRKASELDVLSEVGHLSPLLSYLNETARELRKKAGILRTPSESPFGALAQYGLPAGLARKPGAGKEFEAGLKKVLAKYETAVPEARARAVKDYVKGLTPEQQAALVVADPATVGNLDGVPPPLRFAANRISIQWQFEKEKRLLEGVPQDSPAFKRSRDRVLALQRFLSPRSRRPRTRRPARSHTARFLDSSSFSSRTRGVWPTRAPLPSLMGKSQRCWGTWRRLTMSLSVCRESPTGWTTSRVSRTGVSVFWRMTRESNVLMVP
ncbi:hypothetical protein ACWDRL_25485 [Streptomyces albidoflavus]